MDRLKNMSQKRRQYIMIGGALGLYFGMFFRPRSEPVFSVVFTLSAVITIIYIGIWLWRGERDHLFRRAAGTYLKYVLILGVLMGRHLALAVGGRPAVVIMTVVFGMIAGALMSTKNI